MKPIEGTLTISSDDPDEGSVIVDLTGEGIGEVEVIPNENVESSRWGRMLDRQGDFLAIGAYEYNNWRGGVWIFNYDGQNWVQQNRFGPQGGTQISLGHSVDFYGDYLAVGAAEDNPGGMYHGGSVYMYHYDGQEWSLQRVLTRNSPGNEDCIGVSVSMHGDYFAAGAHWADAPGVNDAGLVCIFKRNGENWNQTAIIRNDDPQVGAYYGRRVDLFGDYLIVGSPYHDNQTGAAYVYHREGESWILQTELNADDREAGDRFGVEVCLEGDYALVGAYYDDNQRGSAYIFHRDGDNWVQQAKLVTSDGEADDQFGFRGEISGNRIVMCSWRDDVEGMANVGSLYLFERNGNNWTEVRKIVADGAIAGDEVGFGLDFSGNMIVVGAEQGINGGSDDNAVYVLTIDDPVCDIAVSPANLDFGLQATGQIFAMPLAVSNEGDDELLVSGVTVTGNAFTTDFQEQFAIQPGESHELIVTFTPEQMENYAEALTIISDDPDEPEVHVQLQGTGAEPRITVTPETVNFNPINVGVSGTAAITVQNTGNANLTVSSVTIEGLYFSIDFNAEITIVPESSQNLTVTFAPETYGEYAGLVTISSSDPTQNQIAIALSGVGLAPDIVLGQASLDFGNVNPNGESTDQILTISNNGNGDLTVIGITPDNNTFTTNFGGQQIIHSGDNLQVTVMFDPDDYGEFAGTLTIQSDDLDEAAAALDLSGVGADEIKILADDAAAGDQFGTSVSIHGNYAIVGVAHSDDDGESSGSVYPESVNKT